MSEQKRIRTICRFNKKKGANRRDASSSIPRANILKHKLEKKSEGCKREREKAFSKEMTTSLN